MILSSSEGLWKKILKLTLEQDVDEIRKELKSNYIDYTSLYQYFYENADVFSEPGGAILTIGDHLRWDRTYPIKEVNFMHMIINMIFEKVI